nr:putative ribonuclease H-like domain-containing protein [Tanacetum cinerariifolium]
MSRGSRYPIANIAKGNLSEEAKAFALSMYSDEIPANTEPALKSKHWKDAMEEEIKALIKNNTWEKRVLQLGKKTVGCRWVFTIKYKPNGTIERYKARLVAKGYTQTYGIDYSETFSPFDVKNAFLHEELKEEIYMEAPHGFANSLGEREKLYMEKKFAWLTKEETNEWGTARHEVLFKQNGNLENQLYTDADWAGDKGDWRSTSGYFTLVGGNLVTWRSKKQKVVALSSAEAEFRGIARGITEVLWIRKLLTEIGYPPQEPSKVMSDNKATIQISKNPIQHDRTKHIEIDRHFIKEKLEAEIITLSFF